MRVGQLLIESGLINEAQLNIGLKRQSRSGEYKLGQIMKLFNYLSDEQLQLVLEAQRHIESKGISGKVAVTALKVARQNSIGFAEALRAVNKEIDERTSSVDWIIEDKKGSAANRSATAEKAKPLSNDPVELVNQSEQAQAQSNWKDAIVLLEHALSILEKTQNFSEQSRVHFTCKLLSLYLRTEPRSNMPTAYLGVIKSLLQKDEALSKVDPGTINLVAETASFCLKHGMNNAEVMPLFKKALPKWAELLPFESEQFAVCLIDAVICSCEIAQVRQNIRVGELLVESKLISSAQFQEALRQSKKQFLPLGRTLLQSGHLTLEQLRNTVKVQLMCRSGVIPAEFAGIAIRASLLPLPAGRQLPFLETLQNQSRATVARDDYLPKLITLMDELILAEEKHGMLHADVALLADKIGDLCYYRAEADEAESMYRRSLKIYEHDPENHLAKSANLSQKLGRLLIISKKYQEAEQCLLGCLQSKSRLNGDSSPELYGVLVELGHLFFSQANYAAAINFLRSAWALKKDDASQAEKIYVFELLIKCFEECGQDAEAANFAEQLNLARRGNP